MRLSFPVGLLAVIASWQTCQAVTIISETFDGDSSTNLNGTITEVGGQTWTANTLWKADGSKPATGTGSAWVPFTPAPGNVYTLSLTVNPDISTSDDWFALGFASSNDTTVAFHPTPNNTIAWILNRENDASTSTIQTFLGPTTGGAASHDLIPNIVGPIDLDIVLDTNPANWTVEWFANDMLLRGPVAFASNPNIQFVGFGGLTNATGTVDNFVLADDTVVPEPASLAVWSILGLAGCGYLWRLRWAK